MKLSKIGFITIIASAAFTTGAAFAANSSTLTPVAPPSNNNHIIAGVLFGQNTFSFNDKATNVPDAGLSGSSTHKTHSAQGVFGGLRLGYGHDFNRFYLGGDVRATLNNAKYNSDGTDSAASNSAEEKITNSYSVNLTPGFYVTKDLLTYLRVGYVNSQFKASGSGTGLGLDGYHGNFSKRIDGLALGLGAQYQVVKHFDLGVEYSYTMYKSFTASSADTGLTGTNTYTYRPSSNAFLLTGTYNFDF